MTRPAADLSAESTAYRLETAGAAAGPRKPAPVTVTETVGRDSRGDRHRRGGRGRRQLELEQLRRPGSGTILPAVEEEVHPDGLGPAREAQPKDLAGDTLTVEDSRRAASFHRQLAEEPKNATLLEEALYEITGRHLSWPSRSARTARRPRPTRTSP